MGTYERMTQMSTLGLLRTIINDVSRLFDREVELAKVEARQTAAEAIRGGVMLAVGGVLGLLAIMSLIMAGIFALATRMPDWLAALIAFAVLAIAAAIVFLVGKGEIEKVKERPLQRTRETLKEDAEWARHRLSSNER